MGGLLQRLFATTWLRQCGVNIRSFRRKKNVIESCVAEMRVLDLNVRGERGGAFWCHPCEVVDGPCVRTKCSSCGQPCAPRERRKGFLRSGVRRNQRPTMRIEKLSFTIAGRGRGFSAVCSGAMSNSAAEGKAWTGIRRLLRRHCPKRGIPRY